MTSHRTATTRFGLAALGAIAVAAVLGFCRPWTIRPIADVSRADTPGSGPGARAFDAAAYVTSVWSARVLPEATRTAVDLRQALSERQRDSARRALLVRGAGVVTSVDERSRLGVAYVDLTPADGQPDVALQIGPVLRGTAVRDALGFIRFSDFANQIDFALVANELNARVLTTVLAPLGKASLLTGRAIVFTGAATLGGGAGPGRTGAAQSGAGQRGAEAPRVEITPLVIVLPEPGR
jgi:predicted lipoprotein